MPAIPHYGTLLALGIAPSLVWLVYFLRKDAHPEPKVLIARTFLMGIIVSPLAIILQMLAVQMLQRFLGTAAAFENISHTPLFFAWASISEELIKFLAVWAVVLRSPEFDEPVDAMIYMVTAALGFAAMENILVVNRAIPDGVNAAIGILGLRFAGATLLHALASALVGYFVAMSWFFHRHRRTLIVIGIIFASAFHFVFNLFISSGASQYFALSYTTLLLIAMAFLISALFDKIRERSMVGSAHLV